MPKFKWTMEELHNISNKKLVLALIDERASDLNYYSRLAMRLRELRPWVEKNVPEDGQNPIPSCSERVPYYGDNERIRSQIAFVLLKVPEPVRNFAYLR